MPWIVDGGHRASDVWGDIAYRSAQSETMLVYPYLGNLKSGCGPSLRLQWGHWIDATKSASNRAMMARRTAGRLGDGGGPGTRSGIFPRPGQALPGEAEMLQVREGHAGHQGMPVQAGPRPTFEVARAQLSLQYLRGLGGPALRLHKPFDCDELPQRLADILGAAADPSARRRVSDVSGPAL